MLAAGVQGLNNARAAVVGSLEALANGNNGAWAEAVARWALHEDGAVRLTDATHRRQGESDTPAFYTIREDVVVEATAEEWDSAAAAWVPYGAERRPILVEWTMIDPYVRQPMVHDGKGRVSAAFELPDVYGVFKARLVCNELGFDSVDLEMQAVVRPVRHDGYERFIPMAYPYYATVMSLGLGFIAVAFFVMFTEDKKVKSA